MTAFEPKIVGFLCNWCSYAGADKAGMSQTPYPPNVRIVRVMCSGRVDPQFVLHALKSGADGVLILACHPGDCHYKEGNYRASQRHRMMARYLKQLGIEPERCRFDYVSASEGDRFVQVVSEFVETVRQCGPITNIWMGPDTTEVQCPRLECTHDRDELVGGGGGDGVRRAEGVPD